MKKILFIIPFFPYPLKTGGHQALFNGIMAIKDNYDVSVAYPAFDIVEQHEKEDAFLSEISGIKLYPCYEDENKPSLKNRILWKLNYLFRRSLGLVKSQKGDSANNKCITWLKSIEPLKKDWLLHIEKICNKKHFDIIQVEMPWFVSQILSLPESAKKVYVHHELGFVRRDLESQALPSNAYVNACKLYANMNEIALLNMYDSIITLSAIDSQKLKDNGVIVPVYSSFATINSTGYNCENQIPCNGKRITFVGPDGHSPNLEGITWFLNNCWSNLLKIDKNYSLDIIGGWTETNIEDFSRKYRNVNFRGYVKDLKEALQGSIMIVPINVGSGIRMKILEAASIGVPFISTSVGAEGIPVKNGVHCLIADSPTDFISAILNMQDKENQQKYTTAAKQMIEKNYSIDALKQNRLNIYSSVLSL